MTAPGLHRNTFTRIACLLLSIYFLNFSIDTRDANPDYIPEDLTYNDIESVAEFFAEVVFNVNNAFEEHEERDSEEGGAFDFSKELFCCTMSLASVRPPFDPETIDKFHVRNTSSVPSRNGDVSCPPPKA